MRKDCARKVFERRWLRKALVKEGSLEQRLCEEGCRKELVEKALVEEGSFEQRLCEEGFRKEVVEKAVG